MLKHSELEIARVNKNKAYDGKFFFAVKTTGIFCRPSCPSPVAKEENVEYYETIFEPLENGFRPCLRCRPDVYVDYYNGNVDGAELVKKALDLIFDGFLIDKKISDLSKKLSVSERHLRKLFVENLGIPPVKVARYHKALFAKKLLVNSDIRITDIAFASGFGSIRQFNKVMKDIHGQSPTALRNILKIEPHGGQENIQMWLGVHYVKAFEALLRKKSLDRNVQNGKTISMTFYTDYIEYEDGKIEFTLTLNKEKRDVLLEIGNANIKAIMKVYGNVRAILQSALHVVNS